MRAANKDGDSSTVCSCPSVSMPPKTYTTRFKCPSLANGPPNLLLVGLPFPLQRPIFPFGGLALLGLPANDCSRPIVVATPKQYPRILHLDPRRGVGTKQKHLNVITAAVLSRSSESLPTSTGPSLFTNTL